MHSINTTYDTVTLYPDYALPLGDRAELHMLLSECFPGFFQDRIYFKQVPKARFLAHRGSVLIGHVAMEDRVIRVGDGVWRIFGVIDLCVTSEKRRQGVGSTLLREIEGLGRLHGLDAVILFADDPRLYNRHGYQRVPNVCRWSAIEDHESVKILERPLEDCLMIKEIGQRAWDRHALVDLLGYLF